MNRGKKILIAIPSFTFGGSEIHSLYTARALKESFYDVYFIGFGKKGSFYDKLCDEGFKTIHFPLNNFFSYNIFKKIYTLLKLTFFLRKYNFEYVFASTVQCNIIFGVIWKILGVKKMFWHQWSIDSNINIGFWEKLALKSDLFYVANSEKCLEYIAERHKIKDLKKTAIIHNTFNENYLNFECSKNIKRFNLVMLANFYPEKDHITLLEAYSIFIKKYPECSSKLFILGSSPGNSNLLLKTKSKSFDVGLTIEKVKIIENTEDITQYLINSDVGVLSTKSEGLSNSLLEYMAFGLPIITTDIEQNKEALGDNSLNMFFSVGDVNGCFLCIEKMYLNSEIRLLAGIENKKRVISQFNNKRYNLDINSLLVN